MDRDLVLECRGVSHWFGPKRVLYDVNLQIIRGEIVSLVGPSGCGKSTLLRAIVGTHPPCEGSVKVKEAGSERALAVRGPGRDRGIVYQQYSLFPFLTARQNVAFGLKLDQTSVAGRLLGFSKWRGLRREHLAAATSFLEKLKLADAVDLYPAQMSGGMRQRVAVAQALIMKPEILLLDEPFGALDEATREELQRLLLNLYAENLEARSRNEPPPYTVLIVTHELNEAIFVGDRVVGLSQYWDWKGAGLEEPPGATVVYDRCAPVYRPDEPRNFDTFVKQREEIRESTFDARNLQPPEGSAVFWKQLEEGKGQGVLA